MKVKMLYTEWLLLTRGELRPEIGDKFVTKMTDEVSTINDEKDLNIIQRLIKMGAFAYVVELEFPTIKWDKIESKTYRGCIGNIDALTIYENEESGLYELSFNTGALMFEGSLTDCKQTANNLLYGNE